MAQPLRIMREGAGASTGVVTIFLDEPDHPVTVLNREMIARLDATLDEVGDSLAGLVVATSHGRVFVAGADLGEINRLSDAQLDDYLATGQRVLGRIAALPCMTVAAINGAALGGGLELALHCDSLLAMEPTRPDKPYRIGLPEASLGLCPGWGGTNTLPARIEPGMAISLIATGATLTVLEAHEAGLLDRLYTTREELLSAARARAAQPKPASTGAHSEPINVSFPEISARVRTALARVENDLPADASASAVLEAVKAGLAGGWRHALEHERRSLISLRSTEATRSKIKAFFKGVKKK